ncbi:MAG: hypothetical protein B6241_06905 [Spirochaetaceae bacterium 4572_59]|nr:MAG: hypothetical protein B6241_06905 [Spirochaetaceae bacterium 4572_59]
MFYLSKLISSFILPPGLFMLPGVIFFFLHKKLSARILRILMLLFSCFLYLISIRPFSDALLRPLEQSCSRPEKVTVNADYIVILGGGTVYRKNNMTLGTDATKRMLEGYLLQKRTGLPLIFSGGSPLHKEYPSEASIASELLLKLGMDSHLIYLEDKSRNTFENAANIKRVYKAESIILVSSAYHMKRSVKVFKDLDVQIVPYPVDYKVEDLPYIVLDYFPSMNSLENSYHALHEYIGMIYYFLRY